MPILQLSHDFAFDTDAHEYFYQRRPIPHVTGLLEEFGLTDYSIVPAERLEYKRLIGIAVHKATELYDLGSLDFATVDPLIRGYVHAWIQFRLDTGFIPRKIELRMYSKRYRFAGTLDREGIYNGKPTILDIKTSVTMHPATGPQVASYEILHEENYGGPKAQRICVLLHDEDDLAKYKKPYRVIPLKNPQDRGTFLSCLHLHYFKKSGGLIV